MTIPHDWIWVETRWYLVLALWLHFIPISLCILLFTLYVHFSPLFIGLYWWYINLMTTWRVFSGFLWGGLQRKWIYCRILWLGAHAAASCWLMCDDGPFNQTLEQVHDADRFGGSRALKVVFGHWYICTCYGRACPLPRAVHDFHFTPVLCTSMLLLFIYHMPHVNLSPFIKAVPSLWQCLMHTPYACSYASLPFCHRRAVASWTSIPDTRF